jgi:hypothetical protein
VTALVVVSLLIPGLDTVTGVPATFMLAALPGHTSLALSGDGSWIDVGLDVFALATPGAGSWAKTILKGSADFADGIAGTLRGTDQALVEGADRVLAEGPDIAEGVDQVGRGAAWESVAHDGRAVGQKFLAGGEKDPAREVDHASRRVEYVLPVPGTADSRLVATFSTVGAGDPEDPAARVPCALFDAIMSTFRRHTGDARVDA